MNKGVKLMLIGLGVVIFAFLADAIVHAFLAPLPYEELSRGHSISGTIAAVLIVIGTGLIIGGWFLRKKD